MFSVVELSSIALNAPFFRVTNVKCDRELQIIAKHNLKTAKNCESGSIGFEKYFSSEKKI